MRTRVALISFASRERNANSAFNRTACEQQGTDHGLQQSIPHSADNGLWPHPPYADCDVMNFGSLNS